MNESKKARKKEKEVGRVKSWSLHIEVSWAFCTLSSVPKSSEYSIKKCYAINIWVFAIYADITSRNVTQTTFSRFFLY